MAVSERDRVEIGLIKSETDEKKNMNKKQRAHQCGGPVCLRGRCASVSDRVSRGFGMYHRLILSPSPYPLSPL